MLRKINIYCFIFLTGFLLCGCKDKEPETFSFSAFQGNVTEFTANNKAYYRLALQHVSEDVGYVDRSGPNPEEGIMSMKKFVKKWIDEGRDFVALIYFNFDGHGYDSVYAKVAAPKYSHKQGGLSFTFEELPLSAKSKSGRKFAAYKRAPIEGHVVLTLTG